MDSECDLNFQETLSDTSLQDSFSTEYIKHSTPLKLNQRRSISLMDVSKLDANLKSNENKLTTSYDTIASPFRDSGFDQTASTTSLASRKDDKKLTALEELLKFKEVLIIELQESNKNLRLKFAEAENRIAELRIKCEAHCSCCTTSRQNITNINSSTNDDDFNPTFNESAFISHLPSMKINDRLTTTTSKTRSIYSNDEALLKVKRWQEGLEATRSSVNEVSSLSTLKSLTSLPFQNSIERCSSQPSGHFLKKNHKKNRSIQRKFLESDSDESLAAGDRNWYHDENMWRQNKNLRIDDDKPLTTAQCRNRKGEMEQNILTRMNALASQGRERYDSKEFTTWKSFNLSNEPHYNPNNILLKRILEATEISNLMDCSLTKMSNKT